MAQNFSHANCDHPATPAARKKCRDNQKKLAAGKIKDTANVADLQRSLTEAYKAQLLNIGALTVDDVLDLIKDVEIEDIDKWFSGVMPSFIQVVGTNYNEAFLLTNNYLKEHAALLGYKVGKIENVGTVLDQIVTSLEVTGPVAFKKHIAAGGTPEEAIDTMKTTLSGSAERLAMGGARDTLTAAVGSDSSDVLGYTRDTNGEACDYCLGLSKETVYDANTFHAHDHCKCTGEPIYLDPRFLPTKSQADFDAAWDEAVDVRARGLEIDRKEGTFSFEVAGPIDLNDPDFNFDYLDQFAPTLVWRQLIDGTTFPSIKAGILDKSKLRNLAEYQEDKAQWFLYAEALSRYTSEVYDSMNRLLRGLPRAAHRDDNIKDSGVYLSDQFIRNMNKALLDYFRKEAKVLPEDYRLYRGIKDGHLVFGKYFDGDLTGMVFSDKGFTSTTLNESTAVGFIDNAHGGGAPAPAMIRVLGRKGTKAVGGNAFEAEVLFAPGVRYRVIRDYEKTVDIPSSHKIKMKRKQRWIDVEIIE